jgi:hypothetical protein
MLFYRLGNNNKTDQGDETEGLERDDVKEYYFVESSSKKKCRFTVPPAIALLSYMTIRELYHTFADYFKIVIFRGVL